MKTAFLFPGQGSQYVGMGRDLYERFPEARARFDEADALLDTPITPLLFGAGGAAEAEAEALRQTAVTQPALFVHSLAAAAVLESAGYACDMAAGHSLGEYSALAAAGAISFADGLRAVQLRGRYMGEAGGNRPGTMAAVLGLEDADVSALCREVTDAGDGFVHPANFNSPGQVVISGDVRAVEQAVEEAKKRGAKRALLLPVSGAFHSPLMEQARAGLARALTELPLQPPRCPVYLNVTGEPATDPEVIRARLLEQLTAPVRWSQTLVRMHADGARRFVEIGAGNVLAGLARRTLGREVEVMTAGKAEELDVLVGEQAGS